MGVCLYLKQSLQNKEKVSNVCAELMWPTIAFSFQPAAEMVTFE